MSGPGPYPDDTPAQLAALRDQLRAELGLLHDRVNALLTAEAFLTIAYTAAMSNGADWGREFAAVAAPVLALLGLLLALLAWPGVATTARLVLAETRAAAEPGPGPATHPASAGRSGWSRATPRDQSRALLLFRAVPPLFGAVWVVLGVLALVVVR